jgi:hypothetical protein
MRESFNARQVAMILRVNVHDVIRLIKQKRIEGRWFGQYWVISRLELIAVCVFCGRSTRWTGVV